MDNTGVVKLVPVPKELPPVAAAYQFMVPAEAVALKTTLPIPQLEALVVCVMVGIGFTVKVAVAVAPMILASFVNFTR